jgi:hypothetical protein
MYAFSDNGRIVVVAGLVRVLAAISRVFRIERMPCGHVGMENPVRAVFETIEGWRL